MFATNSKSGNSFRLLKSGDLNCAVISPPDQRRTEAIDEESKDKVQRLEKDDESIWNT